MELWVYVSTNEGVEVFKSRNEAMDFAGYELRAHGEHWGYDEEGVMDSIVELKEQALANCTHLSTYLGELQVDIYQKFI